MGDPGRVAHGGDNGDDRRPSIAAPPPPPPPPPPPAPPFRPQPHAPIDFAALADACPALKPYLVAQRGAAAAGTKRKRIGSKHQQQQQTAATTAGSKSTWTIDFHDAKAVRELTAAILWRDFRLRLEVPVDSLVPMVANRLDYILWIEHLLALPRRQDDDDDNGCHADNRGAGRLREDEEEESATTTTTTTWGIDVGTGASCIYPLLGCRRNPHWKFLALEIDDRSTEYAQQNVDRNGFADRVRVVLNPDRDVAFPADALGTTSYSFTMCNPPFYADEAQIEAARASKATAPSAVCTGSRNEMITPGGELRFIRRMVDESKRLQQRRGRRPRGGRQEAGNSGGGRGAGSAETSCRWFTSLVGRLQDFRALTELLTLDREITDVRTAVFRYAKTTRWGIAWAVVV
ncbi:hypothetical protein DFJ73DRAFT_144461 [Zopfochytrium polystomum]|nr:hypothetical protein DFJ73DRAFT_144461 [Zopfochytrium polystomum]